MPRHIAIQGIELEPDLCARATAVGVPAAISLDALGGTEVFDLIVAFDVFEHLSPDALGGGLLAQRRQRLGGVLLCRVPNGDSPYGRKHHHGDKTHAAAWAGQAGASR